MNDYRLTPAAQRDLSSIWDCTEVTWGRNQADTFVRELQAALERIAADPRRGRACDEILEGYRRYRIGSHVLFYRARPDGMDVVRILHQRMDPARHL